MTTIEMRVHMDCAGCESKIRKDLQKLKGVDDVDIDMGMQKVTVTGWADQKKILKTVRKKGRRAEIWQLPNNANQFYDNNFTDHYHQQHHQGGSASHFAPGPPSSSYNYYKHGYDYGIDRSYHVSGPSTVFGQQTGSAFSDENPHGCSVM